MGLLGYPSYLLGKYREAIEFYEQALELVRKANDRLWEGYYVGNTGLALSDYGQFEQALNYHKESMKIGEETGNKRWQAIILGDLGKTYRRLGNYADAKNQHSEGVAISQSLGLKPNEGRCLAELGRDCLALPNYEQALQHLAEALAIAEEIQNPVDKNYSLAFIAVAHLLSGYSQIALQYIEKQEDISNLEKHYYELIHGIILLDMGEMKNAKITFEKSIQLARDLITKTPDLFSPFYTIALANAGLALVSSDQQQAQVLLRNAKEALSDAKKLCAAKGIIEERRALLEKIRERDTNDFLYLIKL